MKSDDYVRWLTEQFVLYMNQPKAVRKDRRQMRKSQRYPIKNEMFGLIPNALSFYTQKWRSKKWLGLWRKPPSSSH
ncbi:YqzE family protein [Tuberibacillus calidus]|jgi:hypothetical protein|uniref:YqzE family protein n=1 Tax=Tuberibacillus calidus TaxID=340097 RepID=UPI000407126A|nr:YqzE family protein [Tuberibacillus calidus]